MINNEINGQQIVYFLEQNNDLSETGYKVMKTHQDMGFVPCNYLFYNGKIKLLYNKGELVSLKSMINNISSEKYLEVVRNLFELLINIREIGFLQYRNVVISLDNIFVNTNNLKVSLIYLPLNVKDDIQFSDLERRVYTVLSEVAGNYQNLCSQQYYKFYQLIIGNSTIDNIIKELKTEDKQVELVVQNEVVQREQPMPVYEPVQNEVKKEKFSLFGRKKKEKDNYGQGVSREYKVRVEGGATQILENYFVPKVKLKYAGKANIEIVIDNEDFIIGKQDGSVNYKLEISNAISRVHCKVVTVNDVAYVEDMGSSNGTFVNGNRLQKGERVSLNYGDKLMIANQEFVVMGM